MAETKVTKNEIASEAVDALVFTDQTTSATSFADLATVGPAVTVNIGSSGKAIVTVQAGSYTGTMDKFAGYAITGATTRAADPDKAARQNAATVIVSSYTCIETGLTPGSTTFTMKYRVGSATGNFFNRRIIVIPI